MSRRHPAPAPAIRAQRRVPGGRMPLGATVLREIRARVEADAARYGVSKSFVIAVALAKVYGIDKQEWY